MNDHDPLCRYPETACLCHACDRGRAAAMRALAETTPLITKDEFEFNVDVADMIAAENI